MADHILAAGILDTNNKLYKPQDYNQLITSHHPIKLGKNTVYIVGIINSDKYLSAKKEQFYTTNTEEDKINNYQKTDVYVKGFTDIVKFNISKDDFYNRSFLINGVNFSPNFQTLDNEKEVYTVNGKENITSLKKGELIISEDFLQNVDTVFKDDYQKYTTKEEKENFIIKYLQEYGTYKQINVSYIRYANILAFSTNENLKIVGITLDQNSFISNQYLEEYTPLTKARMNLTVYENDKIKIKQVLNNITDIENDYSLNEGFYFKNDYSNAINEVIGTYIRILVIFSILLAVFFIISLLLFLNYMLHTVTAGEKKIGILRSLGTSAKDIMKIYVTESFSIGIISFLFGLISFLSLLNFINNDFAQNYFYHIDLIIINPWSFLILFLSIILFTFIITLLCIRKAIKITPLEAILKK